MDCSRQKGVDVISSTPSSVYRTCDQIDLNSPVALNVCIADDQRDSLPFSPSNVVDKQIESSVFEPDSQLVEIDRGIVPEIASYLYDDCPIEDNDVTASDQWIPGQQLFTDDPEGRYYRLSANSRALPYEPVNIEPTLPLFRKWDYNTYTLGGYPIQMKKQAWLSELEFEHDHYLKSYLYDGIVNGFKIIDDIQCVPVYDNKNYKSVTTGPAFISINELILKEISESKYVVLRDKPKCVHSLGAVAKSNGSFRPITDCSRPEGFSVNSYMDNTAKLFKYQCVDYVCELMNPGDYSATVDISSAYRAISVFPSHWTCQGVRWEVDGKEEYLVDTRLCFGLRSAPFIFSQVSNFVVRAMARRGIFRVANYLDDYILFAPTFESCQFGQEVLIHLLQSLGFNIAWDKCSAPSKSTRYLGVIFDSDSMQIKLPEDKLEKLRNELLFFEGKTRATKLQIQKLAGYLAHCSKVVRGGRLFSRRIISLLRGLGDKKRIRIPKNIGLDLSWWQSFMRVFNGSASIIRYNYGDGPVIWTDACATGYGFFSGHDWQAGRCDMKAELANLDVSEHSHWKNVFKPVICSSNDNVNFWELIAVWQALIRYAAASRGSHMIIMSDNTQVVAMINGHTSINESCLELLREIFWLSAIYNVYITARYVPGIQNVVADKLSRLQLDITGSELCQLLCCSVNGVGVVGPTSCSRDFLCMG